jgi:hypothetical protein
MRNMAYYILHYYILTLDPPTALLEGRGTARAFQPSPIRELFQG